MILHYSLLRARYTYIHFYSIMFNVVYFVAAVSTHTTHNQDTYCICYIRAEHSSLLLFSSLPLYNVFVSPSITFTIFVARAFIGRRERMLCLISEKVSHGQSLTIILWPSPRPDVRYNLDFSFFLSLLFRYRMKLSFWCLSSRLMALHVNKLEKRRVYITGELYDGGETRPISRQQELLFIPSFIFILGDCLLLLLISLSSKWNFVIPDEQPGGRKKEKGDESYRV